VNEVTVPAWLVGADLALFGVVLLGWCWTIGLRRREIEEWRMLLGEIDAETDGHLAEWIYPDNPLMRRGLESIFAAARKHRRLTMPKSGMRSGKEDRHEAHPPR
jgi:hypothetical protein